MCRLIAHAGSTSPGMRRLLFDQLMLRSVADGDQSYGAGVSDGLTTFKSGLSYAIAGDQWLSDLDSDRMWIGHVRKPSKGTAAASTVASHPFVFSNGLVATHNGFITDTGESEKDEPNVDSYRALKQLAGAVGNGVITVGLLNDWIESFGPYSEWAFMLYHKDSLFVVRGIRPMFYAFQNGGPVFSTSFDVLFAYKRWCGRTLDDTFNVGKIKDLAENRVAHVRLGERMTISALTTKFKVAPDPNEFYIKHSPDGEQRINFQ